jgi:hypothetical protein
VLAHTPEKGAILKKEVIGRAKGSSEHLPTLGKHSSREAVDIATSRRELHEWKEGRKVMISRQPRPEQKENSAE